MALSVGFRVSVSLPPATRVTGLRLLPRWDCLPLSVPAFPGRTGLLSVHSRYNLRTRQAAQSNPLHRQLRALRSLCSRFGCFYEKVVKVKADVAALHICFLPHGDFRMGGELSRALPLGNVHLDP